MTQFFVKDHPLDFVLDYSIAYDEGRRTHFMQRTSCRRLGVKSVELTPHNFDEGTQGQRTQAYGVFGVQAYGAFGVQALVPFRPLQVPKCPDRTGRQFFHD